MIHKNEIRYGNFVNYNGEIVMVHTIGLLGINVFDNFPTTQIYEKLNGIQLTKEVLEKCGFKYKENVAHWANKDEDLNYWFIKLPSGVELDIFDDGSCNLFGLKLEYLHHLQNLYFDLIYEPLEITNL